MSYCNSIYFNNFSQKLLNEALYYKQQPVKLLQGLVLERYAPWKWARCLLLCSPTPAAREGKLHLAYI